MWSAAFLFPKHRTLLGSVDVLSAEAQRVQTLLVILAL